MKVPNTLTLWVPRGYERRLEGTTTECYQQLPGHCLMSRTQTVCGKSVQSCNSGYRSKPCRTASPSPALWTSVQVPCYCFLFPIVFLDRWGRWDNALKPHPTSYDARQGRRSRLTKDTSETRRVCSFRKLKGSITLMTEEAHGKIRSNCIYSSIVAWDFNPINTCFYLRMWLMPGSRHHCGISSQRETQYN